MVSEEALYHANLQPRTQMLESRQTAFRSLGGVWLICGKGLHRLRAYSHSSTELFRLLFGVHKLSHLRRISCKSSFKGENER